jgi:3-deoxy-7-phosphoheptulonate synthase
MDDLWTPASWQTKPMTQRVVYPDPAPLRAVLAALAKLPPLVTSWEVEALKAQLAQASRGQRFLLQGGDCSESFDDCQSAPIASKLKILLKMSIVLVYGSQKQVIRVGRFAGQYAKPRSEETETRDGLTLPSYRGPLVNRPGFTAAERTPNPACTIPSCGTSISSTTRPSRPITGRSSTRSPRRSISWKPSPAGDWTS